MPLVQTRGAASAQGFGEFAQATAVNYIEEVFSTYLYTGNGATQTITNGIDLSTKGGLVWAKSRAAGNHFLYDTTRGVNNYLMSNATDSQTTQANSLTAFNTTGFSIGDALFNDSAVNYVSWTFRKQPKFFDVVTWTGTGSNTTIAHALGSIPACIMVKRTDTTGSWQVYHRSLANTEYLVLNSTAAKATSATRWNSTTPTSTVFSIGTDATVNASGGTYVASLFAHDAGGFGLTGSDNVISCGSTTANGSGDFSVNLGYEPQWVLLKSTGASRWSLFDNMRGATASSGYTSSNRLQPQVSDAEDQLDNPYGVGLNATGFTGNLATFSNDFIYIAIRRGPMKVPTVGTSVFSPVARTGTGSQTNVGGLSFSPDLLLVKNRGNTQLNWAFDKLRGGNQPLSSNSTDDEATNISNYFGGPTVFTPNNTGFGISNAAQVNTTSGSYANWLFGRAPSFFDEVCYTGVGYPTALTNTHNLGVAPEMMIVKNRSNTQSWFVYHAAMGNNQEMYLNQAASQQLTNFDWNSTTPSATTFTVNSSTNNSGQTYVAYLFATCAGVSKVGSYTGTATTLQVNCGFTGGARFVLIKKTSGTGSWYVWDSARGIVSGNDPYLLLNSTAAEVTNTDYIDTYSAGFEISSTAPSEINENGGSFIFLAIA